MFADRHRKVRQLMEEGGYDCLLISPGPNLRYLTGFRYDYPGDPWDSIITWDMITLEIIQLHEEPLLIVPKCTESWAREVAKSGDVRYYSGAKEQITVLTEVLSKVKGTVGMEDHLPFKISDKIAVSLPHIKVRNASSILSRARLVKSEDEVECMRKAAGIVEKGVKVGRETIRESMTEKEISLEVEAAMRKHGAESISYCVVQRGAKTATWDPPSEDRVRKGDLFLMDLSATYNGYHADITRMTVVGKPSEKQKRVYEVVQEAQSKAIAAIRDGVKAGVVNDAGSKVIEENGFGEFFPFGIGHGLGLEAHEMPHLTEYKDRDVVLQPGIVMTIEPTVNLPGEFGIRIEDDVLVTAGGRQALTTIGRDLVQV